jgi:hypothetical protein
VLAESLVDEIVTLKASALKISDGMFHVNVPRFGALVGRPRPDLSVQSSQADQKNETPIASSGPPDHLINVDVPAVIVPATVAIVIRESCHLLSQFNRQVFSPAGVVVDVEEMRPLYEHFPSPSRSSAAVVLGSLVSKIQRGWVPPPLQSRS